jgi:hypothetical protein
MNNHAHAGKHTPAIPAALGLCLTRCRAHHRVRILLARLTLDAREAVPTGAGWLIAARPSPARLANAAPVLAAASAISIHTRKSLRTTRTLQSCHTHTTHSKATTIHQPTNSNTFTSKHIHAHKHPPAISAALDLCLTRCRAPLRVRVLLARLTLDAREAVPTGATWLIATHPSPARLANAAPVLAAASAFTTYPNIQHNTIVHLCISTISYLDVAAPLHAGRGGQNLIYARQGLAISQREYSAIENVPVRAYLCACTCTIELHQDTDEVTDRHRQPERECAPAEIESRTNSEREIDCQATKSRPIREGQAAKTPF